MQVSKCTASTFSVPLENRFLECTQVRARTCAYAQDIWDRSILLVPNGTPIERDLQDPRYGNLTNQGHSRNKPNSLSQFQKPMFFRTPRFPKPEIRVLRDKGHLNVANISIFVFLFWFYNELFFYIFIIKRKYFVL